MAWEGPHDFENGLGHTADADEVMANLLFLQERADAAASSGSPIVDEIPPTPDDGEEMTLLASSARGVLWPFKYRDASASSYKWEAKGATPWMERLDNGLNPAGPPAFTDIVGAPSIVIPADGEYIIEMGATGNADPACGLEVGLLCSVTALASGDQWAFDDHWPHMASVRKNLTEGETIKLQFATATGVARSWSDIWLKLTPVRVRA